MLGKNGVPWRFALSPLTLRAAMLFSFGLFKISV